MKEFNQKHWDDKLQACQTHEEWGQVNAEMEKAWVEYDKEVAADAQANPENYNTYQDKSGRMYTLNPDGSRKYREMRSCEICGERNEVDHESWWAEHMEAHEHKRLFDLERDPLIIKVKRWSKEYQYGPQHCLRWRRVLKALGCKDDEVGEMKLQEAKMWYGRYSKNRWGPVVARMMGNEK